MNGHSDTEDGMVNGVDSKDALSSVLGTPKPMSALPRIPKKKKAGSDEIKKEVNDCTLILLIFNALHTFLSAIPCQNSA